MNNPKIKVKLYNTKVKYNSRGPIFQCALLSGGVLFLADNGMLWVESATHLSHSGIVLIVIITIIISSSSNSSSSSSSSRFHETCVPCLSCRSSLLHP